MYQHIDAYGTGDSPSLRDLTDAEIEQRASDADDALDDLSVMCKVIGDFCDTESMAQIIRQIKRAVDRKQSENVLMFAKSLAYEVQQGAEKRLLA